MLKRVREHPDETGIFRRLTRKIGIPIAAADKKHRLRGEPPRSAIGLWGRNLTNEAVYSAVSGNALTSLSQYAPPRTFGIKFSVEF